MISREMSRSSHPGVKHLSTSGHPSSLPQNIGLTRPSPAPLMVPDLSPSAHKPPLVPMVMAAAHSPKDLRPINLGDPPSTVLEWFQLEETQSYHLVSASFSSWPVPYPAPSFPPLIHDIKALAFPHFSWDSGGPKQQPFVLFFLSPTKDWRKRSILIVQRY